MNRRLYTSYIDLLLLDVPKLRRMTRLRLRRLAVVMMMLV